MSSIQIKRVETKKDLKDFIEFHYDLYEGNQYDAPNLYSDELNTLSRDKNAAFDFCEAEYFLALKEGKVVGRVAAIINNKANEKWDKKDVRFGWIDFIDDIEVSKALLKAVEDYGKEKGMTSIVGPLGFTDMDPEGMLTWGFDQLGTMATIYNYDYYPQHMEKLGGWEKDNDYVEYRLDVPETAPEKYTKIAEMVEKRYNLHARKLTKKEIFEGGYGKKLFDLINVTYSHLYGFSELSERQIDQYVKMYFPLADLDLITVVEDGNKDNQLVGLAITIPSLTRALQKCHRGRLFPFGWWHLLRAIKFHKTEVVDLLLIGVLPEYRSKGANSLVFADLIPRYVKYGFKWGETHVEMETNESVQSQWGPLDPTMHKKRRCYRKAIG
ncbi:MULTISPECIES: N-acetyltransferase [Prevotella]|uniref:N-acetyltransferase n=1 Tax=Prevotella melaninogenica TaxID=28132 RepID=A0ABX7XPC1_9BACT|nr:MULTISPECIES: N-acetyltransferase [Prevotella]QUB75446.1 N-acetyltransferase [Prevotella melaninogenica]